MRLSIKKSRLGSVTVRGGKLFRVAEPHAVPLKGLDTRMDEYEDVRTGEKKSQAKPGDGKWVYCKRGDLALQILRKDGKVLAYSYLSGPALRINRYTDTPAGWFEETPAKLSLLEIPTPSPGHPVSMSQIVEAMMKAKYGDNDLYVFEVKAGQDDPRDIAQALSNCAQYEPKDGAPQRKSHIIGLVSGKRGGVNLHFQPPQDASDEAATPWQVELVLDAARRP